MKEPQNRMTGNNKNSYPIILLVSILCFHSLFIAGGCSSVKEHSVTYEVWGYEAHYEPAPDVDLRIFTIKDSDEYLVQYNEKREFSDTITRRSFLLKANADLLKDREKPIFLSKSELDNLDLQEITLSHFGIYDLPDYYSRNFWEDIRCMALTPGAVAVDLLKVSAVIAVMGAVGFLERGYSYSFSP